MLRSSRPRKFKIPSSILYLTNRTLLLGNCIESLMQQWRNHGYIFCDLFVSVEVRIICICDFILDLFLIWQLEHRKSKQTFFLLQVLISEKMEPSKVLMVRLPIPLALASLSYFLYFLKTSYAFLNAAALHTVNTLRPSFLSLLLGCFVLHSVYKSFIPDLTHSA